MPAGIDADFAAYLAARWPHLVRSLVLIGCPPQEAEDVARTGMARCYREWGRAKEEDDLDVYVYRTVLDTWRRTARRRKGAADAPAEPAATPVPAAEVTDLVLMRRALEEQLARLGPEHREPLVLRFVADLSEVQIAEVLDVAVDTVASRVTWALTHLDLAAVREMTGGIR